ncbi:protein NRT1/ PTR FAMILY 5.4-like isoform X1 [Castanea sativa]|uniref:protein NRT1/ PTR FAMILY 5.4-like isoform X1 n=3 Tax=Castanea sativa TaxID=21020 RepID=UPI003F65400E
MLKEFSAIMVMCGEWFSRIYGKVGKWYHDYIFFSKAVLFIFGLIVSVSMINLAVVEMFIDCLNILGDKKNFRINLQTAATIVNLQKGISSVSAVIVAYIADSYLKCFTMIIISALSYTTGLMLLWRSTRRNRIQYGPIYVAALALALGKYGLGSILKEFLSKQLIEGENENFNESEAQIEGRTNVWWCIASISGSAIAVFFLSNLKWEGTLLASGVVMGVSLLLFCCGFKVYCPKRHRRNSHVIFKVFKAAISKRYLPYPCTPTRLSWKSASNLKLFEVRNSQILFLPKVFWFRWLDKATVTVENTSSSRQEEENLCSVEQVTQVKCFLTLIPLWTTFLAYSLVQATGNTFFIEQRSNLKITITKNHRAPLVAFFVLNSFLRFIIPRLFWSEKARNPNVTLVRIGVGMICSILCCIAAWQVEVHRLKEIKRLNPANPSDPISMSIFWLLPQFILLGLAEGLVEEGLQEFFIKHVTESMWNSGQLLTGCILSFGNFFSIACVQLVRSWFKDTINDSHLDRYFLTLAILSSVFLCFYVYASISNSKYANIRDLSKEAELAPNVSMGGGEMKDEMSPASSSARNTPLDEDFDDYSVQPSPLLSSHPHRSHSILNIPQRDGVEENTKPLPIRKPSFLWRKVSIVMASTRHLYSRLANVEMVGMQSSPDVHYAESMENLPLRSHASTEAEEVIYDDEPRN